MGSTFYEMAIDELLEKHSPRVLAEIVISYKATNKQYMDRNEELEKENASLRRLIAKMRCEEKPAKQDVEHDGCKGCKYVCKNIDEYPCTECKQNYVDKYTFVKKEGSSDE